MRYLKTNTATIITVGPLYDKTDGVTIESALTIANERITFAVDNNDGSAPTVVLNNITGATTGTANDLNYLSTTAGLMQMELAAANVNYLGRAFLTVSDAANHVPVFHEFMILPAMVFDSLIAGTDVLDASVTQIAGAAVSTSTAQLGANVVTVGGGTVPSGAIPNAVAGAASGLAIVGSQVDLVNAPNATAVTAIQNGLATTTELNKVPKSDGTTTWNATALTAIQTQATGALNTYDPPTRAELTTDTNSILSKLLKYVQLLLRKDSAIATDNATELTAINADGGSGAGTFNNTTDAQEAIRDTAPLGTAMRGTDSALLATNYTAPDNAGIAANGVAIGALNNLSSAQAQTAAAAALTAYDPPTRAEATTDANSILSKLLKYVQLLLRKDTAIATDNATEVTAINADGGSGAGAFANTTDSQEAIKDAIPSVPTAADNADAVWDEALAGHAGAGSAGAALSAATAPSAATVADAVWDEAIAGHAGAGSTGLALAGASAPAASAVADAVWDEALSGHAVAGSSGAALSAAGAAADPLASAVPGAYVAGTAGYILGELGAGTPAVSVTSGISSGNMTAVIGETFTATFSGLTISSSWTKIYLTIKDSLAKTDAQSIIQIVETNPDGGASDGLLYLNGAAVASPITAADASLSVNQVAGTITVTISDNATALLSAQSSLHYDLKAIISSTSSTVLGSGYCNISQTPTLTI